MQSIKNLLILSLAFYSITTLAQTSSEIVFPRAKDVTKDAKCIVINIPCSSDETQICQKRYCGVYLKQLSLDKFVAEQKLIGRKFDSIFNLENFLQDNLPSDLSDMHLNFGANSKKSKAKDYNPQRINIILDKKGYIIKLTIG
jgi:hypothetical protein